MTVWDAVSLNEEDNCEKQNKSCIIMLIVDGNNAFNGVWEKRSVR